ncbi:MAG: ABC transporter ATP-binding protein [Firmicutes bacterium]|nr:ABC transporter ATP-binding protein [Bacillota bacterium]
MSQAILKTEALAAGYAGRIIAEQVGIQVCPGEIVALIGPNGSGKTTLLKTVAGFLEPIGGAVYLDGRDLSAFPRSEMARIMSVMMTERMATDQMTVRDVVSLGRYPYTGMLGRLTEKDQGIVDRALTRVGMTEFSERIFNDLSDGQKQRALLARSIAQEPKILLLDEPTSYLDIYHKLRFIDILKDLVSGEEMGVLMSVHELEIAYEISSRVVCLSADGHIKAFGTPQEVFSEQVINDLYQLEAGRLRSMYGGFLSAIKAEPSAPGQEE